MTELLRQVPSHLNVLLGVAQVWYRNGRQLPSAIDGIPLVYTDGSGCYCVDCATDTLYDFDCAPLTGILPAVGWADRQTIWCDCCGE